MAKLIGVTRAVMNEVHPVAEQTTETSIGDDVLQAFQVHCAGRSVLLLEDEPAVGERIRDVLTGAGCGRVVWVKNGLEAVDTAAGGGFDLIILDRNTPGLDGREALLRIRAAETAVGRAPVAAMFLTALGVDRQRLRVSSPGRTTIWSSRCRIWSCWRGPSPCCAARPGPRPVAATTARK